MFRIEDTDSARDSEESYHQLLDALKWLGINWDEGVEVGGPHEPYRQSQRSDIYQDVIAKLHERRLRLRVLLHPGRDRGPPPGRRPRPQARLRRLRPCT